ncbi:MULTISPECIES: TAXI family TRAP transporter solute-binding subunit [unclassified Undibacterium]|uniref:TAXI family TRAP transporter solute-binding subunit n=1 Tax=unclassified Undibacterium TaxID=2630295 RepID=UPI002AC8CBA3|nr:MULTISPECIES: TAXI family TRAP transporter solute-binding subunit [unclassified Undibacterium]MEB0138396.1 TAXI family TRAP transporter solute-binding subunit [Undibacterium sp. CCC2.1]MEB0171271.1 TAXI family TRAP transporter solute-binding subunit [Undibacterium sp. CCC1.1]MEB0176491.1 TAXI family TRAP transporter solute-binding subunit [Undibacterium sp. CCC3.4]MEB0214024.1 TAXI family TRAP transporter solute-binding subunit [Undibacterium sp. 5I2]WPX43640.1 TAXI family TRAP transporter 
MRKLKFTLFSLRDLLLAFGPLLLTLIAGLTLAYYLVDPAPKRVIEMAAGPAQGSYAHFAKLYAADLAQKKITLHIANSSGSQDNLQKISDPDSSVMIGFVRSGSTSTEEAEEKRLVSLGGLFYEPIWIFYRSKQEVRSLTALRGQRLNLGAEGNGMHRLFSRILALNGLDDSAFSMQRQTDEAAAAALQKGDLDVLVMSSAGDAPLVQELMRAPGIRLFNFVQAEAYTRRLPFLSKVVLPRGVVDLGRDIPSHDVQLIASSVTLVAYESLHPALMGAMLEAVHKVHGQADWFSKQGEFPSDKYSEIPVAAAAEKFYKNGPPVLQRYLSFWIANFFERMWIVFVPLAALLLPLSKIIPPLYVWRIRSRVYRWYAQLRQVEQIVDSPAQPERAALLRKQLLLLDELEVKVNRISIPLSYAEELYRLRSHIQLVRTRIEAALAAADQDS